MISKAFKIVEEKLENYFSSINFKSRKVDDLTVIFFNGDKSYKVEYLSNEKQFKLLYANDDNNNLDDKDFKILSAWLFDCETDSEKEAKSIANDFIETLTSYNKSSAIKKSVSKEEKKLDANDIMFFINRLATIFPELKDDIKFEKENYESFRPITFCKEKVLPHVSGLINNVNEKDKLNKLCNIFNNFYENGDLDVRSTITIIFLNSINNESSRKIVQDMISKDLNLAWKAAMKYKNKEVTPEKVRKKASLFEIAQKKLDEQNRL